MVNHYKTIVYKITILVIALLATSNSSYGQESIRIQNDSLSIVLDTVKNDMMKLEVIRQLISNYGVYSGYDSARVFELITMQKELGLALNNDVSVSLSMYNYGNFLFNREGDFPGALEYYKTCLKYGIEHDMDLPLMYITLYNEIGLVHKNMAQYDSAIFYYEKLQSLLAAGEYKVRSVMLKLNMSRMYSELGDYYSALRYADEIIPLGKEMNDDQAILLGLRTKGEVFYSARSYGQALIFFESALALAKKMFDNDESNYQTTILNLARCHERLGNYELALPFIKRYIKYADQTYGSTHLKNVTPLFTLGGIYIAMGENDSARLYLNKAQSFFSKGTFQSRYYFDIYVSLARLDFKDKNYQGAKENYDKVLKSSNIGRKYRGYILRAVGDIYYAENDLNTAMSYYQKSLINFSEDFNHTDYYENPNSEQLINSYRVIKTLRKKATTFLNFKEDMVNRRLQNLESALEAFQLCDTLISSSFKFQGTEEDQISLSESISSIYHEAVETAVLLYRKTGDTNFLETAFDFSEKSKANVLRRIISKQYATKFSNLPDSIRGVEESVKAKRAFFRSKLFSAKGKGEKSMIDSLNRTLIGVNQDYKNLVSYLENEYPQYYDLKYNKTLKSATEISEKLGDRTLLEYVNAKDSIFIFILSSDQVSVKTIYKPKSFDSDIHELTKAINNQEYENYVDMARRLYDLLLKPVEEEIESSEELIIIPDGNLWRINFDILLTDNVESRDYSDLPYLLNEFAISYANSANQLANNKVNQLRMINQCLAFSYSDSSYSSSQNTMDFLTLRDAQADLPGTRSEVNAIAKEIPGTYYIGEAANEANFKALGPNYSVLHLALHGEVNDNKPAYSKLFFTKSQNDSLEDDNLHIYELYGMDLNADLVVLSACNTGAGDIKKGEGIMSLGRAFQYAGVKSIVTSDWEVSDKAAPTIMRHFYANLKRGNSKSEALRKAKLAYLREAGLYKKEPFFWGNFRVIGDPKPLQFDSKTKYKALTTTFVLIVFMIALFLIEKQLLGINRKA